MLRHSGQVGEVRVLAVPALVLTGIAFGLLEVLVIAHGLYSAALIIAAATMGGAVALVLVFLVVPWFILWQGHPRPALAQYIRGALTGRPILPPGRSSGP